MSCPKLASQTTETFVTEDSHKTDTISSQKLITKHQTDTETMNPQKVFTSKTTCTLSSIQHHATTSEMKQKTMNANSVSPEDFSSVGEDQAQGLSKGDDLLPYLSDRHVKSQPEIACHADPDRCGSGRLKSPDTGVSCTRDGVTFGQKHAGHLFSEAWKDQEWVSFMVNRYGSSTKMEHRRFLRYVELKVAQHETHQRPIPVIPQDSQPMSAMSAKAKAPTRHGGCQGQVQSQPPGAIHLPDLEAEEWAMEPEMYASETMTSPGNAELITAMQQRMLNMENALTRMIRHLESTSGIHQTVPEALPSDSPSE